MSAALSGLELSDDEAQERLDLLKAARTRGELAEALDLKERTLNWMLQARGVSSFYQEWEVKKRFGGTRRICAPKSTLYRAQKRLSQLLQVAYRPRPAAHAYIRQRSVVTNAEHHVGKRYVLNVDLQDFFPSIHFGRVRGLFQAFPFRLEEVVATALAQLCCYRNGLPIGAPTSPVIANMICLRLDKELQRLARSNGCWYTRYADDLTLSSDRTTFPPNIAQVENDGTVSLGHSLTVLIDANGFSVNPEKSRLQTRHMRQQVTGLVVNSRLNVDRRFVRNIRAMLHAWSKYGLDAAEAEFPRWYSKDRFPGASPTFLQVLQGRIAYLEMIRGKTDPLTSRFRSQYRNLAEGREINYGVSRPAVSIRNRLNAQGFGGEATADLIASLGDVPSDLLERWEGRDEEIARRVSNGIRHYQDATDADDLRQACRELADALEIRRNEADQLLYNKEEGALFTIANKYGIRHLDDAQFLNYRPEFLIWIFWSYLHAVDLIDQIVRDPGPTLSEDASDESSTSDGST